MLAFRTALSGGDPYFANVSLLLHMDGANNSTTFTDNSNNNRSVTANGNASISTTQSKFGGAAVALNGTTGYLITADNAVFNLSSGAFTIECWFYATSLTTNDSCLIAKDTYGINFSWSLAVRSNAIRTATNNIAGDWEFLSPANVTTNTWNHVALVGNGSSMTHYLNGVAVGTKNRTLTNASGSVRIGAYSKPDSFFAGFIDELRVSKVARYTSDFTVPSAAFPDS